MTIEDAITWVDAHRRMLAKRAISYTEFAPYAVNDYLQDAYEAAIKAAVCCQKNPRLEFEGCFTRIWRDIVASVTPFPDEAREAYKKKKAEEKALREGKPLPVVEDDGDKKKPYYSGGTSMSFPTSARRHEISLEMFPSRRSGGRGLGHKIEQYYTVTLRARLSDQEAQAMEYSLGLTGEGRLSEREIAKKMGVTRDSVREYIRRAVSKARPGRRDAKRKTA